MKTVMLVWVALITLPLVVCGALFAAAVGVAHPDWPWGIAVPLAWLALVIWRDRAACRTGGGK